VPSVTRPTTLAVGVCANAVETTSMNAIGRVQCFTEDLQERTAQRGGRGARRNHALTRCGSPGSEFVPSRPEAAAPDELGRIIDTWTDLSS